MARKIRLGNDIDITWSLLDKDENPYIVEGRDFEIEVVVGTRKYRMYDVSASGNQIHFVFYGKDQRTLGNATLVYIENGGRVDMVTFDTKDAFEMVPHSWLAVDSDEHPETVTLDVVTVLSNLASSIGPRGYSAYEIARQHGYTGTEEQWLDSLKPHITADAEGNVYCDGVLLTDVIYRVVSAVTADEQERQEAETARQAAENSRVEAETARQTAESSRVEAETARQTAENARVEAETARQTAESGRQTAEAQRGENETTRQSQETARVNAEAQRGENETTRQSQETARVNAEQNRTTEFNGLKSDMQTAIQQMGAATETVVATNEGIQQNETARQQAESGRVAAENARQSAEQTRGQNEQTRQTQEGSRQTAETTRQTQESTRQTKEGERQTAEEGRATAESGRVSAEESRVASETAREEQAQSDHARAESDHERAEEDHEKIADKADVDGYYSGMTVGLAENLIDTKGTGTEQSFVKRTSCGDQSIADDGAAIVQRFFGKSFVWNQLLTAGNFPDDAIGSGKWAAQQAEVSVANNKATIVGPGQGYWQGITHEFNRIAGHKYYICLTIDTPWRVTVSTSGATVKHIDPEESGRVSAIWTEGTSSTKILYIRLNYPNAAYTFTLENVYLIDLTLMFGAGNEPTSAAEFDAWIRNSIGVAPYYGYTPGMLMANKVAGIRTIGFNRYNHATGNAELVKYDNGGNPMYQITGEYTALSFTDALGNTITPEVDAEGYFDIPEDGVLAVTGGNDTDTCVHLCWSGYRDGEYEKYWEESRVKELTELKGKLNGAGESVVVFPDGLKSAGTVRDEIVGNKAIKRVASVNLGDMDWGVNDGVFWGTPLSSGYTKKNGFQNIVCSKYTTRAATTGDNWNLQDKEIGGGSNSYYIYIKDSAYTDAADFKASLMGVYAYFEIAEYDEYILDEPFNTTYKVADFGTEEIIPSGLDANLIPQTAPFTAIVKYNDDFTREIVKLPQNYVRSERVKQVPGNSETDILSQKAVEDNYAHKSGYEPGLGVGAADNITGKSNTEAVYRRRTAGGTADIGSGAAAIARMKGRTMVWNQLVGDDTESVVVVNGHKYLSVIGGVKAIGESDGNAIAVTGGADIVIDLTLLFGAGNEPATVAEFEAMFPLPYYEYSEPKLVSNKAEAIKTVGFNQWDEEWEQGWYNTTTAAPMTATSRIRSKNHIPIFPNTVYNFHTDFVHVQVNKRKAWCLFFDINKNVIEIEDPDDGNAKLVLGEFTTPTNAYYMLFYMQNEYGGTYKNDICINLSWSGYRNGEYEPYWESVLPLNLSQITGKLNGEGESVVIFPDGLRSAGTAFDELVVDSDGVARKAIKRIGNVDLGALTWQYSATTSFQRFVSSALTNIKKSGYMTNIRCSKYLTDTAPIAQSDIDKTICCGSQGTALVVDHAYTDAATFKAAMDGVILYYEMAVYEEYILDTPIAMNYRVDDFGTEERLPADTAESVLPEIDYDVKYSINARDTLRRLPETFVPRTEWAKWGIISQNQTWSGNDANGYTYTLSNKVYGWIPNPNIDLFVAAGASFNEQTGYFEMNGLTDLSYNEIKKAYNLLIASNGRYTNLTNEEQKVRTTFPLFQGVGVTTGVANIRQAIPFDVYYGFWAAPNMQVLRVARDDNFMIQLSENSGYISYSQSKIREVIGVIGVYNVKFGLEGNMFSNGPIEKVSLWGLRKNWKAHLAPRLSLESVVFAVQNAQNGATAITITLHATAYARCVADTTEYTYNSQTYTGIIALAAAKNITIQQAS